MPSFCLGLHFQRVMLYIPMALQMSYALSKFVFFLYLSTQWVNWCAHTHHKQMAVHIQALYILKCRWHFYFQAFSEHHSQETKSSILVIVFSPFAILVTRINETTLKINPKHDLLIMTNLVTCTTLPGPLTASLVSFHHPVSYYLALAIFQTQNLLYYAFIFFFKEWGLTANQQSTSSCCGPMPIESGFQAAHFPTHCLLIGHGILLSVQPTTPMPLAL